MQRIGYINDSNLVHNAFCDYCKNDEGGGVYLIPIDIEGVLTSSKADEDEGKSSTHNDVNMDREESILSQIASILSFSSTLDESNTASEEVDIRNGRWTKEETQFVDELIKLFENGSLPLPKGLTLNDFLRNMLMCKSTRLRKKMKNANFCTRTYEMNLSILITSSPLNYTQLCDAFLMSVDSEKERCLIRFAMKALWGSHFLEFCSQQDFTYVDANDWLTSLEKIEQRCVASRENLKQKQRRRRLSVVVQKEGTITTAEDESILLGSSPSLCNSIIRADVDDHGQGNNSLCRKIKRTRDMRPIVEITDMCGQFADWTPFLERVGDYIKSENLPFQYVDVWVAETGENTTREGKSTTSNIQLRHLGHAVRSDIDSIMTLYHMSEFGKYSSSFVFPSGVGLPGRVFETGHPVFDGCLQAANRFNFPRAIGARTHGIEAGVGIPINCLFGRVILALYSTEKLKQDINLTQRLCKDLELFQPKPTWTVLVDAMPFVKKGRMSSLSDQGAFDIYNEHDPEEEEMITLIGNHLSTETVCPAPSHLLSSANALRFLLLKNPRQRSLKDANLIDLLKKSYRSYLYSGTKSELERLGLLLTDYVYLKNESDEIPHLPLDQNGANYAIGRPLIVVEDKPIEYDASPKGCHVAREIDQRTEQISEISEDEIFTCEGFQLIDDDDILSAEILQLVDLE